MTILLDKGQILIIESLILLKLRRSVIEINSLVPLFVT